MHDFLITKYYFINKFDSNIINQQDRQTIIIYRNYSHNKVDELLILKLKKFCKLNGNKFFLSNDIKLAIKLDLDGVYLPSFNKNLNHLSYSLKKKFQIVGSAHNLKEMRTKELQRTKKIFLSSLFKKNKNYLGINKFRIISRYTKQEVIALGGISKKNVKKLKLLCIKEFAGISYFE